jgi:hypothetical protein
LHRIPELGPVDLTQGFDRQVEVHPGRMPGPLASGEGAAGDHVVDVGMGP